MEFGLVVGVSQTAAFDRGRHLYSAGRPSRWALAHISSCSIICGISLADLYPRLSTGLSLKPQWETSSPYTLANPLPQILDPPLRDTEVLVHITRVHGPRTRVSFFGHPCSRAVLVTRAIPGVPQVKTSGQSNLT